MSIFGLPNIIMAVIWRIKGLTYHGGLCLGGVLVPVEGVRVYDCICEDIRTRWRHK
jgi:hypothetical protein